MWQKISSVIVSFYIGITGFLMPNPSSDMKVVVEPTPIVVEVTPTSVQPTERALKVASFVIVRLDDKQKAEFKQKHGAGGFPDNDFIRKWAIDMDSDPVLLSKNEALIAKYLVQENRPIIEDNSTYTYPVEVNTKPSQPSYDPNWYKSEWININGKLTNCTSMTTGSYTSTNCY